MISRVPLNDLGRQSMIFRTKIHEAISSVIDRGWYVLGPESQAFETEFAEYCQVKHAIGVGNGTDALEISLRAVGVRAGDRVATVANAGGYTTIALNAIGAIPLYIDVDPDSFLINSDLIRRKFHEHKVVALIVTHLFGRLANIDAIVAICKELDVKVIEDCAQAHGAKLGSRHSGSFGAAGCFSFYPTKNLGALGDGGAIVTNDPNVASSARALRQYGWDRKYEINRAGGRNTRLDEIQAAVLRIKLKHLDASNRKRRAIAQRYVEEITNHKVTSQGKITDDNVVHLFVIKSPERDSLRFFLDRKGVGTDVHYPIPDHAQIISDKTISYDLPVTEKLANEILTIPCFPEMTDEEATYVIRAINEW